MNIIVNGRKIGTMEQEVPYSDVVALAFDRAHPNASSLTVTYRGPSRQGSLIAGESVQLEDGMVFNVADTGDA
jgi:hypothetical protein